MSAILRRQIKLLSQTALSDRCSYCGKIRTVYSQTGKWEEKYNTEVRKDLEKYWKARLENSHTEQTEGKDPYYVLSMFPYPSGRLHMGHVRVYTISDVMARYNRSKGKHVVHPMGWDAFGLPAENAAIERNELPVKWTNSNIAHMKKQLEELGCSFDWDRELATCDPSYYRWTQYIFLKLFEAGLVYQKKAAVNWDPVDQTVLADEQIDENGCSWRSGAKVEKRLLKQWYIRTSAYSRSLVDGLSEVDTILWKDVIDLQKHWIGEVNGYRFEMKLQHPDKNIEDPLPVFTQTPHAIYGATHVLLSTEHPLIHLDFIKTFLESYKTEPVVCLPVEAIHPFNGQKLPLYLHRDWDYGLYLDSHLAIPCLEEKDQNFAKEQNIPFINVMEKKDLGDSTVINSESLNGLSGERAIKKAVELIRELKCGGYETSAKCRDWLISRQRYWGTPIPIIHCPKKGVVPVPFEELPVLLPEVSTLSVKGASPLSQAEDWLNVKCPGCDCGGFGKRETDTMDTFVDSSWYFLRYLDPHNQLEPFSPEAVKPYIPVGIYIGGKEHAIMHLYYARFIHHFLYERGLVPAREPFTSLLTQGMVMGKSYKIKDSGRYIPAAQVDFSGGTPVERDTGAELVEDWEKMSKSKYNGVDPQDVLDEFGTEYTRLSILSNVAPKTERHWSTDKNTGVIHWQNRVWSLVTAIRKARESGERSTGSSDSEIEDALFTNRNVCITDVSFSMDISFNLNVVISRLHALTNDLRRVCDQETVLQNSYQFERGLCELVIMISPMAPMFASELWSGLQDLPYKLCQDGHIDWSKSVLEQRWPSLDEGYHLPLKVKVETKTMYEVPLPVAPGEMDQLTLDFTDQLARGSPLFEELKLHKKTTKAIRLNLYPGYKAEVFYGLKKNEKKTKKKKGNQVPKEEEEKFRASH